MALTFIKLFASEQLPSSVGTIYTCPVSPSTSCVKNMRVRLTNTTNGAVTATLYAVPSGGTPGASNECFAAESISANSHVDVDIPTLGSGDTLQGLAGAATSITIHELGGVIFS